MVSTNQGNVRRLQSEVLLDQQQIAGRVSELGREITADYAGKTPVLVGVLKGCMVFLSDLMRHIDLMVEVEFVSAASYSRGTVREDEIVFERRGAIDLEGRDILVVEAVVDSGRTVTTILKEFESLNPASIEIVTLVDKPASHRHNLDIKYRGFTLGNEFLIGYGLDNTQLYRNLPYIGKVVDD